MDISKAWGTLADSLQMTCNGDWQVAFVPRTRPCGPYVGILLRLPEDKFDVVSSVGEARNREIARAFFTILAELGVVQSDGQHLDKQQ
jgi:hypothetical protein